MGSTLIFINHISPKESHMQRNLLIAAILATAFAAPVFAQGTATPKIDQRQENQQNRIANGIKSGELTAKETQNLEKREVKIEGDKQAAKADGKVTAAERRKLTREENKASRAIYRKKHNARTAS
jgi:Tfp pilus assembly protein FimT